MKTIRVIVLLGFLLVALKAFSGADEILKHRGYAGFTYRALSEKDRAELKLPDLSGVLVTKVFSDTPAFRAGLYAGDVIRSIGSKTIPDDSRLVDILRNYFAGNRVEIALIREGKAHSIFLVFGALPEEKCDDLSIEYTSFSRDGIRFRAVLTSPLHSENRKLPALLMVSALGSPRLAEFPGYDMYREVCREVARKGFRVLRFELRGYGDSEGEDYRRTDFLTEIEDNLAAFDSLGERADVDPGKVFVFGHSTGGITAAILAGERPVAGLVTSCTIGRTYFERLADTVRMQDEMGGIPFPRVDENIRDYLEFTISISRGDSLEKILKTNPGLSRFVNESGRIMDDRTAEYWKQQLNVNLAETYAKIKAPVLIIYGASDFLTQLSCHEHIRDVLLSSGNHDVRLTVIPGLDHRYSTAQDKKESFQNYKSGKFIKNSRPFQEISEWLVKKAAVSPMP